MQSAVSIPVPDSDEELAHEQVQSFFINICRLQTIQSHSFRLLRVIIKNLLITIVVSYLWVQLRKAYSAQAFEVPTLVTIMELDIITTKSCFRGEPLGSFSAEENNWRVNKFHSNLSDVDHLFSNDALILRQFISPPTKLKSFRNWR